MMSKKKEQKFIFAIRSRPTIIAKSHKSDMPIQTIGSLHENFILAIGSELTGASGDGILIEQEKNKQGQYQFSFQQKGKLKIQAQNILLTFPISCNESQNRFHLTEEDFRKFVTELKTILHNDDSDDSEDSKLSESQQQISSIEHKCRGRPKGSKNKKKYSIERSSEEEFFDQSNKKYQEKRGRGRPKGAKNIKKSISDDISNEFNIFQLFSNLFQSKSIEEVTTKINRMKQRDERQNPVIKKEQFQGDQGVKRSRGRPKGVKNKPKINNQQSQSEQTLQLQTLPKRKISKNGNVFGKCCSKCQQIELKKQFFEGKNVPIDDIPNPWKNFSIEDNSNMFINAIKHGQQQLLKKLMQSRNNRKQQFIIGWDANSRLQQAGYTIRTRKQYISKNRREGIYSLIQDSWRYENVWWRQIGVDRLLESMPNSKNSIDLYNIIIAGEEELKKEIDLNVATLVRSGNEFLSAYLIENILKDQENALVYGYSRQHIECLSKKRNEIQFRKAAMLKQNYTSNFCSPIHCATINSNVDLLTYILKHISEFSVGDSLNRKPIHYAAVLQTPKALQILVKFGADLKDIDKKKMTPLMLAAQAGRYKNIKFILDKVRDQQYINFKGEQGLSALHYATIGRHQQCINLLLEDLAIEKEIQTKEGMNILHLAAGSGQKELIKPFMDRNLFLQPDNYRRTPLMLAIRNHHNDIFFQLFTNSARYYKRDYSYNTFLHYAAAYGNVQIVKYLLDLGMTQSMNRKSFYPFEIAVLKGHILCAKMLENWNLHYSQHLLNRILKNPRGTPEFFEIFSYLISTKKYDLNYCNSMAGGNTCLHFVCSISEKQYYKMRKVESSEVVPNQYKNMMEKIIKLLLENGADPNIENDRGQKPVTLCIENQNLTGIQLLLNEIPFEIVPPTRNNHFIHYMTNIACIGSQQMKFVLQKFKAVDERVLRVELKKTDWHGFEFLGYLIKRYTQTVHSNFMQRFNSQKMRKQEGSEQKNENGGDEIQINRQVEREAVISAFEEYCRHEEWLIKMINFLVEMGSDPKFVIIQPKMQNQNQNYKRWGIQHFLMKFPSLNLLKIFMKWIDTNFNMQNSQGRTPLHLFCIWNREGNLFNNNPLCFSLPDMSNFLQMKQFQGERCLMYLLQNGLTPNVLDINRSTPLLYAAMNGQLGFVNLLRSFGSTINNINSLNQVPLIQILKMKDKFTIEQIQSVFGEDGAKPDFKDSNERNALHHLVSGAKNFDTSPQLCKKLFQYGVKINSLDKFGRSPIFYCFIRIDQNQQQPQDSSNDKVQILQTLLSHESININLVDIYQRTPLHYACQKRCFFSILYLLDKQIDYDMVDAEGNTPLAICLRHRNLNQAALLIKKGVRYGHVVDGGMKYSYFAYAVLKLSVGICFILIDHGYPLQKALEEVTNETFKRVLMKRYV